MPADIGSSQVQVIFMPPGHFSIFIVQRGTIIMFMPAGIAVAPPIIPGPMAGAPMPIPAMLIPARSIDLVVISVAPDCRKQCHPGPDSGTIEHARSMGRRTRQFKMVFENIAI
jgi:hypothetical protein